MKKKRKGGERGSGEKTHSRKGRKKPGAGVVAPVVEGRGQRGGKGEKAGKKEGSSWKGPCNEGSGRPNIPEPPKQMVGRVFTCLQDPPPEKKEDLVVEGLAIIPLGGRGMARR